MVKFSRTTFEMGCSLPVSSAGAVPLTANTVSVALFAFPKKPGTVTIQLLKVRFSPYAGDVVDLEDARQVRVGALQRRVGDRRRGREEHDESGGCGVRAGMERWLSRVVEGGRVAGREWVSARGEGFERESTLKVPPTPARSPGRGEMTV